MNFQELNKLRKNALESNDIEVVKDALKTFSVEWLNVSGDLSYYQCLFDGSWPNAKEILERTLETVKTIETTDNTVI